MKIKVTSLATILFGILLFGNLSINAQNCPAKFVEKNGLLVIEAENLLLSSSWKKESSKSGFRGSGYITWTGGDQFNNPGVGVINTSFQIKSAGTYTLQLRHQIGKGSENSEYNDTFFRFSDANEMFGEDKNGPGKAYPKGSGKTPVFAGSGSNNWVKVYLEGKDKGWNVTTGVNDENPHHFRIKFNKPGVYRLEISARSKMHLIDQIILTKSVYKNSAKPNLKETGCGGTVNPPTGNCIPEIKYPGGRIAMSFDGNKHDYDDVGALPLSLAFVKAAGLQDKVVFVEYSNNSCTNDNRMNKEMKESAQGMINRFGYKAGILNNFWENKSATTNKFIDVINASSASNRLWIIAAGPMETCWRALNGANRNKLQFVSIVSHSSWNENYPNTDGQKRACGTINKRWKDIQKFRNNGLSMFEIKDQNGPRSHNDSGDFSTPRSDWNWMTRNGQDADTKWLHSRDFFTQANKNRGLVKTVKFDPSDAGMVWWLITGGPNGGDQNGGSKEAQKLLENPCDGGENPDNGPNKAPTVSFRTPSNNITVDEGYKLNVEVTANDSDGSISNVKLYINTTLIRQENVAPYEWGLGKNAAELNGRKAGVYTIRAVATDNKGKTGEKSITMRVRGNSNPPSNNCNFGTPKSSGIPALNKIAYTNMHVVGSGGPSINNFRKFTINWNPGNNGVYQFAINTTNGSPDWYVDFKDTMSFQLKNARPEVTLKNTGFAGLDGSYWVNSNSNSFILVSKEGNYSVHFSNASKAPTCSTKNNDGLTEDSLIAEQNPFSEMLTLSGFSTDATKAVLYDLQGKQVLHASIKNDETQINLNTQRISNGVYFAKVISKNGIATIKVIKNQN